MYKTTCRGSVLRAAGAVCWPSHSKNFLHPNFKVESPKQVAVVSVNGICGYFKISWNLFY